MHLKRIEIFGFKSFAIKTRLEFEPGITAIIGPNGCGKTNIADAIKWALGEQSMRSLRCTKTEDLIFNGSQSRLPLSFAEVSLTIDNEDGILPTNYSEVTIIRRLYRSGESEYYLNKTQCRLKDIRDLFLDTGLGAQSYSLMEQGKVEFILLAKPEERRILFDEAAGIAKYKVRKEEALSKLEKVEIDLLRLSDTLTLLKEQIRSLDAAVRKAKQYQKYQEELKTGEILLILRELKRLREENENLTTRNKEIFEDYETLSKLIQNLETNLVNLKNELNKKREEISQNQNLLHQMESDLLKAENRITLAEERIKENEEQMKILAEENNNSLEKLKNLQENLEKLTQEKETREKENVHLKEKLKEKEKETNELGKKIKEEIDHLEEKKRKTYLIVQQKTQIKNEIIRLETHLTNLQNPKKQLEKELSELVEKKDEISLEINGLNERLSTLEKEISTLKERKVYLENELSKKKNLYRETISQLEKIQNEISQERARLSTLQELAEKTKFSHLAIQSVLSLNFSEISGPLSSLIKVSKENEKLIEKVLGEKLNFLVSETQESAEKAIRYLKENNKGWAGFFIIEKISEKLLPLSYLPKTKSLLELIDYEPKYKKLMYYLFSASYFDSVTLYSEAIIQGGSEIKENGLLTQKREVKEIEENLNKFEELAKQYLAQKDTLEKEISESENELSQVNQKMQEKQISLTELLKEKERKKDEQEITLEEIEVTSWEINQKDNEINEKNERLKEEDKKFISLEIEEKNLSTEIETSEKDILLLKDKETKNNQELTELKISFHTSEQEYKNINQGKDKLIQEKEELEKNIQIKEEKNFSLKNITANEKEVLEKEKEKILCLKQNKEEIEKIISTLGKENYELGEKISREENSLNSLKQEFKEIEEKKKDFEINTQKNNLEKKHLQMHLKDEFNLTVEETERKYDKELEREISLEERKIENEKLKKKIESLGAVNLAAPEEYENLNARLDFLLTQEEDLQKAKEDLHQLINKINISTRESFEKTFTRIRKNFQQTFRFLFEGGEADLVLTDEINLWETGIEIVAQPAGKKLQNISLLSGGEKVLTAIALLFAFFLVKPAPFCLLDEVDAALDDANIYRFVRLVKEFTQKTQFIIITHNKRTIEIADILYGVTMEEFGVSKIISVKLQKAPALVG